MLKWTMCVAWIAISPSQLQEYQILVVLGVQGSQTNIYPYIYVISYGNRVIPNNLASAAVWEN